MAGRFPSVGHRCRKVENRLHENRHFGQYRFWCRALKIVFLGGRVPFSHRNKRNSFLYGEGLCRCSHSKILEAEHMSARLRKCPKKTSGSAVFFCSRVFGVPPPNDVYYCARTSNCTVHSPIKGQCCETIDKSSPGSLKVRTRCWPQAKEKGALRIIGRRLADNAKLETRVSVRIYVSTRQRAVCDCWVCDQLIKCARERLDAGYIHQLLPMA